MKRESLHFFPYIPRHAGARAGAYDFIKIARELFDNAGSSS